MGNIEALLLINKIILIGSLVGLSLAIYFYISSRKKINKYFTNEIESHKNKYQLKKEVAFNILNNCKDYKEKEIYQSELIENYDLFVNLYKKNTLFLKQKLINDNENYHNKNILRKYQKNIFIEKAIRETFEKLDFAIKEYNNKKIREPNLKEKEASALDKFLLRLREFNSEKENLIKYYNEICKK